MPYNDDLSQEKAPTRKTLLPEGWRTFKIVDIQEATSKSGNLMFKAFMKDSVTEYIDTVYLVRVEGKRWLLKQVLAACSVVPSTDGKYQYELSDMLNKDVEGLVIHEDNNYINREGVEVKAKQHKIVEFRAINVINMDKKNPDGTPMTPDQIIWNE